MMAKIVIHIMLLLVQYQRDLTVALKTEHVSHKNPLEFEFSQ